VFFRNGFHYSFHRLICHSVYSTNFSWLYIGPECISQLYFGNLARSQPTGLLLYLLTSSFLFAVVCSMVCSQFPLFSVTNCRVADNAISNIALRVSANAITPSTRTPSPLPSANSHFHWNRQTRWSRCIYMSMQLYFWLRRRYFTRNMIYHVA